MSSEHEAQHSSPYAMRQLAVAAFIAASFASKEAHFVFAAMLGLCLSRDLLRDAKSLAPVFGFFWIFIIAALSSLFSEFDPFVTLKSTFFLLRPIIYLFLGIVIAQRFDKRDIYTIVIWIAVCESVVFLVRFYLDPFAAEGDRFYIRSQIGHGSFAAQFAIAILLGRLLGMMPTVKFGCMTSLGLLIFISGIAVLADSRTTLVGTVVISSLIFVRWPPPLWTSRIVVLFLVSALFLTTPFLTDLAIDPAVLEAKIYDLPESIKEVTPLRRDTAFEINNYWRGYETFLAFDFVKEQGLLAWFIGTGLGTQVNLPLMINLGDGNLDAIPVFHNAFSWIFVRSGLVGLAFFISLHAGLCRTCLAPRREDKDLAFFTLGAVVLSVLTAVTTAGLLNTDEPCIILCFVIGWGIAALTDNKRANA